MLTNNESHLRCIILSKDCLQMQGFIKGLEEKGIIVHCFSKRKSALSSFLQYRHTYFITEAGYLPRYPFRLLELFKIAHRTPGMIILNPTAKAIAGFKYIKNSIIEIIDGQYESEMVENTFKLVEKRLSERARKLFMRDMTILLISAVPLVVLSSFLLCRN